MTEKEEVVFKTPWFSIVEVPVVDESNTYYSLVRPNGVICLILTDEGKIVFTKQFRPPLKRNTLEIPAGGIEKGETPKEAAVREIFEETGYRCDELIEITPLRLMINRENVVEYFFIGIGAKSFSKSIDTIEVLELSCEDLKNIIVSDQFDQSVALSGIYIAEKKYGFHFFDDGIDFITEKLNQT